MWSEFIVEGLKKFTGEIIGIVLLTFVLWAFPGLRSLFTKYKKLKKDDTEAEIERVREVQRSIEAQRKEEERLKEALKEAERQEKERVKAEEAQRRAEIQKQLEAERREQERIKAEFQRREEELRQAQAQRKIETQKQ